MISIVRARFSSGPGQPGDRAETSYMNSKMKRRILIAIPGAGLMVLVWCNLIVQAQSGRTHSNLSEVPHNKVGMVPGCVRYLGGKYENPFFRGRIDAAWALYQAGKIDYILVSGDNHRKDYDETTDMKQALIDCGVPAEKITCDYAGFSTLDSVVRAKEVFGQASITVISQRFHNLRAIYIANASGLDAVGYNASEVKLQWALKTYLRESLSRVKAVWDVHIARRHPKFLGEPVRIGDQ